MNKFLLTFTLLLGLCFQMTAQTTTFNATTDNDWYEATNWSTGVVPVPSDEIEIASGKTLEFTGTATVKRIKTSGSGTLHVLSGTLTIDSTSGDEALEHSGSSGVVINDGTIIIQNTTNEGVLCKGTFTNNGTLTIMNTDRHNLSLKGGSFTNNATGIVNVTLNVASTSMDGILIDNNGTTLGTFTNDGTVNLTMTSGDDGVDITDDSSLINNGAFNISGGGGDMGIRIRNAGILTNNSPNGVLTIVDTPDEAIYLESTDGGVVNNNSTIDISNSLGHGIDINVGTFNNNAGALYKAIAVKDGIYVRAGGTVINNGDMWLDLCTSEEIEIVAGATFTNTATATFHPGSSPGDFEIKNDLDLGSSCTTFEIGGTAAGTAYDQYENFGGSSTTSNLTISSAKAHLDWGAFVPAVDDCFKIIDGSGSVTGAFASITSSNPAIVFDTNPAGDKHDPATEVIICISAILPVNLAKFEGKNQNTTSILFWQTQTEIDNDYFEVQYSTDGREFTTIDMVAGNGTTSEVQNYDYTHKNVTSINNYYRLKQVDFDGDFEYSDIIYLKNDTRDTPVAIYPNPASGEITYEGVAASLTFYDIQGRQVIQQNATRERTAIDISILKSGVYTIEILTNTGKRTFEKLIKE